MKINKTTWYILLTVGAVLLIFIHYYFNRDTRYHYYKVTVSVFDEDEKIVWDTVVFEKGELIIRKCNPEYYKYCFLIQNYDEKYGYFITSDIKKGESKMEFDIIDEYEEDEYNVVISNKENTAILNQETSLNNKYNFYTFYLD